MIEDGALFAIIHVAHEWGIRPVNVLEWSVPEFALAIAYLAKRAEQHHEPDQPENP